LSDETTQRLNTSEPAPSVGAAPKRLGYQPALDGLRAVAVGLVVLHHLESPERTAFFVRGAANIGVDVFFVISGFLITRLLIDEHASTGRISLVDFWKRRGWRLLPLAVAVISAVWLIGTIWPTAFFRAGADVSPTRSAFAALTYHMNFMMMFESTAHEWALTHTWSLSIEEQFYLVWPVAVLGFVGLSKLTRTSPARAIMFGSLIITIASSALRFANSDNFDRMYNGIDSRAGQLGIGCALGAASVAYPRVVRSVGRVGPIAVAALFAIGLGYQITFRWSGFSFDVVAILAAIAVAGSIDRSPGRYTRLATSRPAVLLGARSYAIYLIHYPVFLALTPTRLNMLPTPGMWAVRLAVAGALVEVAHRGIELPVARYRKRRSRGVA
jgi:peptidoglycan/LPS O-acetylase OafA/YrhL